MFILRDLLTPLQEEFSNTAQGQKRKVWFAYTLLAVAVPFTSSITSNLLRALQTLFGLDVQSQRFYTFMASTTLPWKDCGKPCGGRFRHQPQKNESLLPWMIQ